MYKPGTNFGLTTQEGPKAVQEAIDFLRKQKPLPALEADDALK